MPGVRGRSPRGRRRHAPRNSPAFGFFHRERCFPNYPTHRFCYRAQNLKVKSFVGTSRNALLIQIWTALIAMLLLRWMHHLSKAKWSFSNLASMLRLNLFTYRDLRRWLENPFGTPPLVPLAEQLSLDLT